MHFALVTAPTITEFRSREEILSRAVQQAALQPQLGILSVASVLEQWGDLPHLFDVNAEYLRFALNGEQPCMDEFADYMGALAVRSNADVYGLSSICSSFPLSLRIADAIKRLRPHAMVLFGGPQASVVDEAVLRRFPAVGFVLRGEVERSLPIFLRELCGNYRFADVPGLCFRDGNQVYRTASPPVIEDLDSLPSPAYHLSSYLRDATSASIELGRGCPFSCSFCSTNDFFRRRFRLRSPERVLADMRQIAETYGISHFELVHDMFTVDRKRVVAFCETLRASGEAFTWDCSARTDCVDAELLQQMASSGCRGLFFGIESGSTRMQRIIDKDLDPAKAEAMLQACEDVGIRTTASLIVGFPEENWADVADTLQIYMRSARCKRSHPQLNLLAPLAGTPLQTRHAADLILTDFNSSMSHQGLSQADMEVTLIRENPDIFSNFYRIPTPDLDWTMLFDLREWLSMITEHFRWLLCALVRRVTPLDLHKQWLAWSEESTRCRNAGELRRYYARDIARSDFLRFVQEGEFRSDPVVSTLLRVEATLASAGEARGLYARQKGWRLATSVQVLTLSYSLSALTAALAAGDEPTSMQSFYASRKDDSTLRLHCISPFLAKLLKLFGAGSGAEIGSFLRQEYGLSDTYDLTELIEQLIHELHKDGWITFDASLTA
ncbi:B12-binding domain-containing radical SAM protein [Terriglobus aquaticus]|uniref:B12-binding domain-containing radical SAM protein n=1 Tax=Terriglobus aquaticus TaxID=940139 RepID=A0ABW9KK01_9BACT|nr:radical SAM protein [Terriglobus aquaticus]